MKTVSINTGTGNSNIYIGESLSNLRNYLPKGKTIIITDEKVHQIYGSQFGSFPVISIGLGEKHKTFGTLELIFDKLVGYEADRTTFVVAIGGGIVCDVAGFAASIYMRGLRYGFISTTLLSQVDASVGGKNGVNFRGYKNMIGVFNQPEFVIADIQMLKSLDEKEFRSGFAEIIKAAAIRSESLFQYIEDHYKKALQRDPEVLEHLIHEAVKIKAQVVQQDEKEAGERKILNFGHTFAHSIEHHTGMLHGEAVSIGMNLAAGLSVDLGLLSPSEHKRLITLLTNLQLPVDLSIDFGKMVTAIRKDKKREGDDIHMILIDRIGNALIRKTSIKQLENKYYDLR